MKINVIGAGTWGTTLACLLSNKADVSIWQRSAEKTAEFTKTRQHPNLKDCSIPDNISFTSNLDTIDFNDLNVFAVLFQFVYCNHR